MSLTKWGFIAWAGAALVVLFQGISGLMKFNAHWTVITLGKITNKILDPYIAKIPYASVADFFDFVLNTLELSILLAVIGLICLILGAFKKV